MTPIDSLGSLERRVYEQLRINGESSAYAVAKALGKRPDQGTGNVYRVLKRMEPYGIVKSRKDNNILLWSINHEEQGTDYR